MLVTNRELKGTGKGFKESWQGLGDLEGQWGRPLKQMGGLQKQLGAFFGVEEIGFRLKWAKMRLKLPIWFRSLIDGTANLVQVLYWLIGSGPCLIELPISFRSLIYRIANLVQVLDWERTASLGPRRNCWVVSGLQLMELFIDRTAYLVQVLNWWNCQFGSGPWLMELPIWFRSLIDGTANLVQVLDWWNG